MRPLFNMPYFTNARSRFRMLTTTRHGGESSQSLQGSKEALRSRGIAKKTSGEKSGHGYIRGEEKHGSWYLAAVEKRDERHRKENSESDTVPFGRIAVKYEIELSDQNHV